MASRKPTPTAVARKLEAQLEGKLEALRDLQAQHERIWYQHHLLAHLCDLMDSMRAMFASEAVRASLQVEQPLLQQLRGVEYSGSQALSGSQVSGKDSCVRTIASTAEPLSLMTRWMLLPPGDKGAGMCFDQFRAAFREFVRELSVASMQLQATKLRLPDCLEDASSAPRRRIEALFMDYLALLKLYGGSDSNTAASFALQLNITNYETGELLDAPNAADHAAVVAQLKLARERRMRIADGFSVIKRLQEPILQELRQLQLQQPAAASAAPQAGDAASRAAALEAEASRVSRLQVLMAKDGCLRWALMSHTYGCLTWDELASLYCLMHPFMPATYSVCAAVEASLARDSPGAASGETTANRRGTPGSGGSSSDRQVTPD